MKTVRAAALLAAMIMLSACAHSRPPISCGCIPPPEPEPGAVTPQAPPQG